MRTVQLLGLLLSIASVLLLYLALYPLTPESRASTDGAAGLFTMFIIVPMFGASAFLLIPSSFALLNTSLRENTYFRGKFWYTIWAFNSIISISYLLLILYFGFLYLTITVTTN